MPNPDPSDSPAESTRAALVAAALHFFGHKGFAASSTREIAARAGANIAAIAYHFGGKDGLRLACAEAIAARLGGILAQTDAMPAVTPEQASLRLETTIRAAVAFLATARQAEDIAAFMLREVTEPGPVLDRIYAELIEPRHRDLCRLWGLATNTNAESDETRLAVFAMMGQVLYFRIGRPLVLRRMGWTDITPEGATRIADLLVRNLHAALAATERTGP